MTRLSNLISSGIGLAMEAAAERQRSSTSQSAPILTSSVSDNANPQHRAQNPEFATNMYKDESTINGTESENSIVRGRLVDPVIIPQRRPENLSRGWMRAYAPSLMNCGIDEKTFLTFLDGFNSACKSSPYLDAVNVAAMGVGFVPGIAPMVVGLTVPVAVRLAKSAQTKYQSSAFLKRSNTELFIPHGLYAMIMTYKPDQQTQITVVDSSQAPISPDASYGEFQLPSAAPLNLPKQTSSETQDKGKFSKMVDFIGDYADRRAQARFVYNNPESSLNVGPSPTFASRFGDPNHPINPGSLLHMLTGQIEEHGEKDRHKDNRKRKGKGRDRSKQNGRDQLHTPFISAFNEHVRSKVGGGEEDRGLLKSLRRIGMQKDVLYLMIVNNPSASEILEAENASLGFNNPPSPGLVQERMDLTSDYESQGIDYSPIYQNMYNRAEADQNYYIDHELSSHDQQPPYLPPTCPPPYSSTMTGSSGGTNRTGDYWAPAL